MTWPEDYALSTHSLSPSRELLVLPDRHGRLQLVDQRPAGLEGVAAVGAGHGDDHGEVADRPGRRPGARRRPRCAWNFAATAPRPGAARPRPRDGRVAQAGHALAVVVVPDRADEERDPARLVGPRRHASTSSTDSGVSRTRRSAGRHSPCALSTGRAEPVRCRPCGGAAGDRARSPRCRSRTGARRGPGRGDRGVLAGEPAAGHRVAALPLLEQRPAATSGLPYAGRQPACAQGRAVDHPRVDHVAQVRGRRRGDPDPVQPLRGAERQAGAAARSGAARRAPRPAPAPASRRSRPRTRR